MKILVTGGAGFIGSAVVRHIIENTRDEVRVVDCLTYAGNLESLEPVAGSERYSFSQTDITDAAAVAAQFSEFRPDIVMHLAAESHVDRSIDGPAAFIQTNVIGTFTLLEAARHYWSELGEAQKQAFRFHHISTDEVYGDLHGTDDLFTEETPYAPSRVNRCRCMATGSRSVTGCMSRTMPVHCIKWRPKARAARPTISAVITSVKISMWCAPSAPFSTR